MMELDRRTVLFVETDDWAFAKHRIALARRLADHGYRVAVAAPRGEWAARIMEEGFAFYEVPLHRSSTNPWRELATVRSLLGIYRRVRPDVVHHIALKAILYGSVAARAARVPAWMNYMTGLGYLFTGDDLRRRVLRTVISPLLLLAFRGRRVANIFENQDDLARLSRMVAGGRSRSLVGNGSGVDTDRFVVTPEPPGHPVVLFPSRLLVDKGIVELVEAARILRDRQMEVDLVMAGAPDPENPSSVSENMLESWTAEGLVRWLGYVDDMPSVYARAHIVCLPSYREGLSVSLLEAAASGRPIVTTDVPGCREVVEHEINGLLVPPRDPSALADALERLTRSEELRRGFGEAGRKRVERSFSNQVAFDVIFDLYEELVGDRARRLAPSSSAADRQPTGTRKARKE